MKPSRKVAVGCAALLMAAIVVPCALLVRRHHVAQERRAEMEQAVLVIVADEHAKQEALEAARKAIPPDAPIPPDWNYEAAIAHWGGIQYQALLALADDFIQDPNEFSQDTLEWLQKSLEIAKDAGNLTALEARFDPAQYTPAELRENLREFVVESQELVQLEAAINLGLCRHVYEVPVVPRDEDQDRFAHSARAAALLTARAVFEAEAGGTEEALQTCLIAYELSARSSDGPSVSNELRRCVLDRTVDRGVWAIADSWPLAEGTKAALLDVYEARRTTTRLATTIRAEAALLPQSLSTEADEEGSALERMTLRMLARPFSSVVCRGAWDAAQRLVPLLDTPPYQADKELEAIESGIPRLGLMTQSLVTGFMLAYKLHARHAFMADVARVAFDLKDYKVASGAYPESLYALVPYPIEAVPRNPITGNPIDYVCVEEGFTLTVPHAFNPDLDPQTLWRARR